MKNDNKRTYSKENYLRNGTKTQNQYAKNSFNNNVQEPALNESGEEAELLMSEKGSFITGADFLVDGGATAAYFYGDLNK